MSSYISKNENLPKFSFLKKGEGKLASDFHGKTKFAIKRLEKIIKEQEEREKEFEEKKDKNLTNSLENTNKLFIKTI